MIYRRDDVRRVIPAAEGAKIALAFSTSRRPFPHLIHVENLWRTGGRSVDVGEVLGTGK